AAAKHSRLSGAPGNSWLAGLSVGKMAQPYLDPRQVSRWSRHGRTILPRRDQAHGPGRKAGHEELQGPGVDAGTLDHYQSGERHQAGGGRERIKIGSRRL